MKILKKETDPRQYNGAMFVGLNGISVKSHGGSDAFSFACAVNRAINMARHDLCAQIKKGVEDLMRQTEEKEKGFQCVF